MDALLRLDLHLPQTANKPGLHARGIYHALARHNETTSKMYAISAQNTRPA